MNRDSPVEVEANDLIETLTAQRNQLADQCAAVQAALKGAMRRLVERDAEIIKLKASKKTK